MKPAALQQPMLLRNRVSAAEWEARVANALAPNLNDLTSHKSKNGMREWSGLLRMLDRIDPSYKE